MTMPCPACRGTGMDALGNQPCSTCDGFGSERTPCQTPALRLLAGDASADDHDSGWVPEPRSLSALAVALEHLVGPEPDDALWIEQRAGWDDRLHRAADILVEVSNRNAELLRAVAGPPYDSERAPPGVGLLVLAAVRIERGVAR